MPLGARSVFKTKPRHRCPGDEFDSLLRRIGYEYPLDIARVNRALIQKLTPQEVHQRQPEFPADEHERKIGDLLGLHQHERLEDFIECAETSGHRDKTIRIFHEHQLPNIKMIEGNPAIEVGVRLLLMKKFDVAPNRVAAGFFGAAIGSFHNAWAATGHNGKAGSCELRASVAGPLVIRMIVGESSGSEYGYAWADEMKRAKAANQLGKNAKSREEFETAWLRPLEELDLFRLRLSLSPFRQPQALGNSRVGFNDLGLLMHYAMAIKSLPLAARMRKTTSGRGGEAESMLTLPITYVATVAGADALALHWHPSLHVLVEAP